MVLGQDSPLVWREFTNGVYASFQAGEGYQQSCMQIRDLSQPQGLGPGKGAHPKVGASSSILANQFSCSGYHPLSTGLELAAPAQASGDTQKT